MGHSSLTLAWRRVKRGSGPGATRALKWRCSPISEPRNSTRQHHTVNHAFFIIILFTASPVLLTFMISTTLLGLPSFTLGSEISLSPCTGPPRSGQGAMEEQGHSKKKVSLKKLRQGSKRSSNLSTK